MVIGKFMVGKEKHVVVKMDHATHTIGLLSAVWIRW